LSVCEKKLLSAESQVNELQARLNDAVNQRRHWEDEYNVSFSSDIHFTIVHIHTRAYGQFLHRSHLIMHRTIGLMC